MDSEQHIIASWKANALNWIKVIEENGIESRRLATNSAIIDAVCKFSPLVVLDIGCGEGWLAKELRERGIAIMGVDVIPELVAKAQQKAVGNFWVASYEDIAAGKIIFPRPADVIVINFALIAKDSTEKLLPSLPQLLAPGGKLVIQTLHPHHRWEINDYITGWKEGSWDGLGDKFTQPYKWYFRTQEDWLELLARTGFGNIKITEVFHPYTVKPLSVIFECGI